MPRQSMLRKRLNAAFSAKMVTLGLTAMLLAACGGGGGSSDSANTGSDSTNGGSQPPDTVVNEDGPSQPPPQDPITPEPAPTPTPTPDEGNQDGDPPSEEQPTPVPDEDNQGGDPPSEEQPPPAPPPATDGNGIGPFISGIPETFSTGILMSCTQGQGGSSPLGPLGSGLMTVSNGQILVRSGGGNDLYFRPSDAEFSANPQAQPPFTNVAGNDTTLNFVAVLSDGNSLVTNWNVSWTTSTGAIVSLTRESTVLTPPIVICSPN